MNDSDRIEEHRDLVAGLEYEDWWNDRHDESGASPPPLASVDASPGGVPVPLKPKRVTM